MRLKVYFTTESWHNKDINDGSSSFLTCCRLRRRRLQPSSSGLCQVLRWPPWPSVPAGSSWSRLASGACCCWLLPLWLFSPPREFPAASPPRAGNDKTWTHPNVNAFDTVRRMTRWHTRATPTHNFTRVFIGWVVDIHPLSIFIVVTHTGTLPAICRRIWRMLSSCILPSPHWNLDSLILQLLTFLLSILFVCLLLQDFSSWDVVFSLQLSILLDFCLCWCLSWSPLDEKITVCSFLHFTALNSVFLPNFLSY